MHISQKRTYPGLGFGIAGIASQLLFLAAFLAGVLYDLFCGFASGKGFPAMEAFSRYLWLPFIVGITLGLCSVLNVGYKLGFSKSEKHGNPSIIGLILGVITIIIALVIGLRLLLLGQLVPGHA